MSDKRAPRRSLDDWMELVTECRQSGLTDAAWCEAQGISPSCFYNAVSRLRKRACQIPDPIVFKRSTLNYYRLYSRARKLCKDCPRLSICEIDQGAIRINASGNYPAFHRNKLKYHTPEYVKVMRLRKIWAEGTFSVLKREHNLKRIHKRGIIRAEEECLFSAMALNLKRLVKAM